MTYGIYTRDLTNVRMSNESRLDVCKQYCKDDCVVCTEKEVWCSLSIRITFHAWREFRWNRWDASKTLGFVTIEKHNNYYTWADKIVYDPKKEAK
jgi:hypothetical protein